MPDSSNDEYLAFRCGIGAGVFFGILIGFLLLAVVNDISGVSPKDWEENAIKHNAAQYNLQTGKFEWIENKPLAKN